MVDMISSTTDNVDNAKSFVFFSKYFFEKRKQAKRKVHKTNQPNEEVTCVKVGTDLLNNERLGPMPSSFSVGKGKQKSDNIDQNETLPGFSTGCESDPCRKAMPSQCRTMSCFETCPNTRFKSCPQTTTVSSNSCKTRGAGGKYSLMNEVIEVQLELRDKKEFTGQKNNQKIPNINMPIYRRLTNIGSLVLFYVLLVSQPCIAEDDLRCFLLKGGSVQNFFVPESLSIGSVIGTLNIGGDPRADGDVYLRLENTNSPVQISPNSKNLILTEKLDKEGQNGLSHVVINVICQKRKMNDVDTRIPINIRVTDANDNSPIFLDAPYYVNVSEATVVGTKIVGDIRAFDNDQNGPYSTVQYSIAPGPHSEKFAFQSPISGDLQLMQPLDFETDSVFNLTIVAEDQGSPPMRSETFVTIQVMDSDDQNPAFTKQRYMAFIPDKPLKGKIIEIQPEPLKAEDQDKGIRANIYYSLGTGVEEATYFAIDPNTGEVFLANDIPEDTFRQPVALYIMATQVDNPDREASAILTISRRGASSPQLQFLQRSYEATVLENLPIGSVITRTIINKNQFTNVRFSLERGGMGVFKITPNGTVVLDHHLDYEKQSEYDFQIYVNDGEFNDTAYLKVNLLNVNDWDPRFQFPQYAFHVTKKVVEPGDVIGNVTVADGDRDHISLSIRGRDARMFDVNSSGEIMIRRYFDLNSTDAHIVLVAKDTGEPPRQSSVPVTIHFPEGLVKSHPIVASSSFLLMVVFGSLVAVFISVIICLAVYIHKKIHPRVDSNSNNQYINNIKKYRDDTDAALPTKMSRIITNGGPPTMGEQMSSMSHQDNRSDLTGIEAPRSNGSILEAKNSFKRGYIEGSLRGSTISVQSNDPGSSNNRRFLRNPLAMGSNLGGGGCSSVGDGGDSLSLNGSNATTASTATVGSDSPQNNGSRSSTPSAMTRILGGRTATVAPMNGSVLSFCTYDGTARATGGLPHQTRVAPTPPAPPLPPSSVSINGASTSGVAPRKFSAPQPPYGGHFVERKIVWPSESIPKKVKKLSWEDERSGQTELIPEVSVMPLPPSKSQNPPNLTVYF